MQEWETELRVEIEKAVQRNVELETILRVALDHFDTPRMMPPETRAILDQMRTVLGNLTPGGNS